MLSGDSKFEFVLWDIAGQQKFNIMRKHFYKGANGQILVFDLTRPETLESIPKWYEDIKNNLGEEIQGIIVGNKNDLVEQRQVMQEKVRKIAEKLNLEYIETSALTGVNVDEAFLKLGEKCAVCKEE